VVAHRDFLDSPPLSSQVHVTTKEPQVAADMLQRGVMTTDSCVNYADITNQRFYVVRGRLVVQTQMQQCESKLLFFYRVVEVWNSLPDCVCFECLSAFKRTPMLLILEDLKSV